MAKKKAEELVWVLLLLAIAIAASWLSSTEAQAHDLDDVGVTTFMFKQDHEVIGAVRSCFYERGPKKFRLAVRPGVKCPIEIKVRP